ncbi:MAG: hypothetical protein LBC41_03410 [Clostridiales bacterium]|nr:hypothetical protein [Clostridiales bacterium]
MEKKDCLLEQRVLESPFPVQGSPLSSRRYGDVSHRFESGVAWPGCALGLMELEMDAVGLAWERGSNAQKLAWTQSKKRAADGKKTLTSIHMYAKIRQLYAIYIINGSAHS